ncbi:hypothetical protein ACFU5N_31635 [Streptomyces albidoflavus]
MGGLHHRRAAGAKPFSCAGARGRYSAHPRGRLLFLLADVSIESTLQLNAAIMNVALPGMRTDLDLGVSEVSWLVNGFSLTFAGLLFLAGRLGGLLGHRRLFL